MNERIRLPAQEWLGYDPEKGDIHGYTFEQMREFTESIIQQCIDLVDKVYHEETGMGNKLGRRHTPYQEIVNAIEDHFGIEE